MYSEVPLIKALYGAILINVGDYKSAIVQAEEALSIDPGHWFSHLILEMCYYLTGDYEKSLNEFKQWYPLGEDIFHKVDSVFFQQGYISALKVLIPVLEESVRVGVISQCDVGAFCARAGNYRKALEWYEKAYEAHDPNVVYILCGNFLGELMDLPGFIELLNRMNLPVD